jgi:uncharacterized protein (TIGR03067 family)
MSFTFCDGKIVWCEGKIAPVDRKEKIAYRIRADKHPKEIDVTFERCPGTVVEGRTLHGIYCIEGDRLKICWSHKEGHRPTKFTGEKEPTLFILERKLP